LNKKKLIFNAFAEDLKSFMWCRHTDLQNFNEIQTIIPYASAFSTYLLIYSEDGEATIKGLDEYGSFDDFNLDWEVRNDLYEYHEVDENGKFYDEVHESIPEIDNRPYDVFSNWKPNLLISLFYKNSYPHLCRYDPDNGDILIGILNINQIVGRVFRSKTETNLSWTLLFVDLDKHDVIYYFFGYNPLGKIIIEKFELDEEKNFKEERKIELYSFQIDSGWTNFDVFRYNNENYFLRYRADTGQVNISKITNFDDIVWSNYWSPGWANLKLFNYGGCIYLFVYRRSEMSIAILNPDFNGFDLIWKNKWKEDFKIVGIF